MCFRADTLQKLKKAEIAKINRNQFGDILSKHNYICHNYNPNYTTKLKQFHSFIAESDDLSSTIEKEGKGFTGKIKPILNQGKNQLNKWFFFSFHIYLLSLLTITIVF